MKPIARLLFAALLSVGVGSAFPAAPGEATPVLAQDLVTLRNSSKVSAAIWTRRANSYTLQLVMKSGFGLALGARALELVDGRRMVSSSRVVPADTQPAKRPQTSVWLLRADGTQILPGAPSTNPSVDSCSKNIRCIAVDVQYRFSIADATAAVAIAVRIDDEYFIEKLQPLEQAQKQN